MKKVSFKHRVEYIAAVSAAFFFSILPVRISEAIGKLLGWAIYRILGIRKRVTLDNLRMAFPEKSEGERRRIALNCYMHWGAMMAEFARLPRMNRKYYSRYVKIEGREVLDDALEKGGGGLVISGHLGNWETLGGEASHRGYGVDFITKNQANKLVDKMMDDFRRAQGIGVWKTHQAPRGILKSLRRNRFVAIMIDQDARRDCVFTDFFGREASTHRGAAVFHLKTGAPLIMSTCVREKRARYRGAFEKVELDIPEGTIEEKERYVMSRLTKLLEEKVRLYPEQYFWLHKRWKTKRQGK